MTKIPTGLVLPRGAMPKYRCEICGEHFYEVAAQVRHITTCVKKNSDAIEKLHAEHKERDPLAGATDTEALEWQRKKYGLF